MRKATHLDDLEMHDLLCLCYPEHFSDDDDNTFEVSQCVAEEAMVDLGRIEVRLADLLGRIVMLTHPMQSALTGRLQHALGQVEIKDGSVQMTAAVSRSVK